MNITNIYNKYLSHPNICIDSRKIKPNSIFFGIKGEFYNGNKFAKQAIENGCYYAVIDDPEYESKNCILVKDSIKTLQALAKVHRKNLRIPVIGITGSNGKTTTKELINSTLSSSKNTYSTKGNLNSQIGVALSILEIDQTHEIAVIEMGANQIGEIKKLCEITRPTHGIITNIGKAHLEGFGNITAILKEKTELYKFILKNNGIIFVNGDDKILLKESKKNNIVRYGKKENIEYTAKINKVFPFVSIIKENKIINSNLVGEFQYYNILSACCIANHFNIHFSEIKKSIELYVPKNNRTEIVKTKDNYIILDAYNANPTSVKKMITYFSGIEKDNKVCIIGEMRELGKHSKKEHKLIIDYTDNLNLDAIFIGKDFKKIQNKNTFKSVSDFIKNINKYKLKNNAILIKGSRGLKLEKLINYF